MTRPGHVMSDAEREKNRLRAAAWYAANKERALSTRNAYRRRTRTPESARAEKLWLRFRMTVEDYDAILSAQGGVCAICFRACSSGHRLSVDHDHRTGVVRGLLCKACNLILGQSQDSPDRLRSAASYLERNS